jgi:hypothetical protein
MVTWRSMRTADGGVKRLRRWIVDVIDVACGIHAGSRGVTTAGGHDLLLYHLELRNGDDDHHRRCR